MKKEEIPQDDSKLVNKNIKELYYVLDENGNYTTAQSTGWEPKTVALDKAWEFIHEFADEIKKDVLAGKLSPIAYYIELKAMDIKLLSDFTGIWQWRIKRHLKPGVFKKINHSILEKYAKAFEINVEDLINFK